MAKKKTVLGDIGKPRGEKKTDRGSKTDLTSSPPVSPVEDAAELKAEVASVGER